MSSFTDRLGALSKDPKKKDDKDAKEEEDKADISLTAEEYTLTKQVIIQRDERGYGLTVSGDNPVFVQSVKENGAAARAGVNKGDRILKVNGTLVTKCNHKEVVKLIKSGSYVALTLLGPPSSATVASPTQTSAQTLMSHPGNHPASPETSPGTLGPIILSPAGAANEKTAISGPTAVNPAMDKELKMQKISMIRFMYEKECEECEKLTEEVRQNPAVQVQLEEKLRVRGRLGDQLYQLTGIPAESHISSPKSPPSALPPPGGTYGTPPGGGFALPQRAVKRHGSGDIHYVPTGDENGGDTNTEGVWTGGPKHLKTKSMPESFYTGELPPSGRNVTVSRSNSDSRKQRSDAQTDGRDSSADDTDRLNISSVSSNVHDTSGGEQTTNQNVVSSPQQMPQVWDEMSESHQNLESPNSTRDSVSPLREIRPLHVVSPHQADVIPMEEEEEEVNMDDDFLEDHGPFSDLNRLKHKPAHLAVFLYYLISNSDPSPLLFYLVTEQYTQGSMKELKRWAYEIYSTFLIPGAAIKVEDIDESVLEVVENVLVNRSDKEDIMRTVFQNARHIAQKQISELLADFRQKRTLGLANLYGDNELSDNMDRAAEVKTIENKLLPHLEKCTRDVHSDKASSRDRAMAWALATIMKQLGVTPTKNSTLLERCQSFISKDKKPFKFSKGSSKKNGHQFVPTHYHSTAYCAQCRTMLWGVGYQGLQCSNCEVNVHKHCLENITEFCSGRRKKEKRTSMLNMLRKTTNPNPAAIKEAQRIHDESSGGHMTSHASVPPREPLFQIRAGTEEEEELEALRTGTSNKVSNLVEQYSQLQGDGRPPTGTPPRAHSPEVPDADQHKKTSANLGRSESLNKKRENRRSVRRTRSDVQVDDQTLKSLNQSGSSSNSSLSNRSLDSPSTSAEALSDSHHPVLAVLQEDSDFEVEAELPPLLDVIPKDQLKKLKKHERERQAVINELFYTERAHVQALKVIDKIFRVPMTNAFGDQEMIDTLFYGIQDLIEVHSKLNNRLKKTRKESCVVGKVAQLLLDSFDGEAGEEFKKCAAKFCRGQSHALDYLRTRQRKDPKLATFIQEASNNPLCRRLELKDIIPKAMQRLTKYPLLIGNLMKETSKSSEDYPLLQKAHKCSRDILDYVNQAVREFENKQKLIDMQKRLDKRGVEPSITSFDLQRYTLVHDGLLTWRITKQKQIQLHVLLLDTRLVLLQKQDDRLILKYQSISRDDNSKSTHSPIIELSKLMVRPVATDKQAIFLISDGDVGPQIYELAGTSTDAMKKWFKYLSEGTSENRQKAKAKSSSDVGASLPPRPASMVVPDTTSVDLSVHADPSGPGEDAAHRDRSSLYSTKSKSLDNLEKLDPVEVHDVIDTELAQPSEVVTNTVQVSRAEVTSTPSERLKQQEEIINTALAEKRSIMAEIMGIPSQDFPHISEMAAEAEGDKEPRELIVASLHHADQLTSILNSCLVEPPVEGDSAEQRRTDHDTPAADISVSVPSRSLLETTAKLRTQLHQLMEALAQREKEQERLQAELLAAQTQVTQLLSPGPIGDPAHQPLAVPDSRPTSFISVTSSASEADGELAPPAEVSVNQVTLECAECVQVSVAEDDTTMKDDSVHSQSSEVSGQIVAASINGVDVVNQDSANVSDQEVPACTSSEPPVSNNVESSAPESVEESIENSTEVSNQDDTKTSIPDDTEVLKESTSEDAQEGTKSASSDVESDQESFQDATDTSVQNGNDGT